MLFFAAASDGDDDSKDEDGDEGVISKQTRQQKATKLRATHHTRRDRAKNVASFSMRPELVIYIEKVSKSAAHMLPLLKRGRGFTEGGGRRIRNEFTAKAKIQKKKPRQQRNDFCL